MAHRSRSSFFQISALRSAKSFFFSIPCPANTNYLSPCHLSFLFPTPHSRNTHPFIFFPLSSHSFQARITNRRPPCFVHNIIMDKPASSTTPSDSVITIPDVPEKTALDSLTPQQPPVSSSSKIEIDAPTEAPGPGQSPPNQTGGDNGVVTPPFKELIVVLIGLMLGLFLSSLDQTIVAVCTTKIANDFDSLDEIPWVGTTYLLTSTTVQPL